MLESRLIVEGGRKIEGEIRVQEQKTARFRCLPPRFCSGGTSVIHNCPALSDAYAACRILSSLGCKCKREQHSVIVDSSDADGFAVSDGLMREMRSSIVFLGAILGRTKRCRLSFPGRLRAWPQTY